MIRAIVNEDHLQSVLAEGLGRCRRRLLLATADVKELHMPVPGMRRAVSIVDVFEDLSAAGVEIRMLHSGVPSRRFIERLKESIPAGLTMRRCPRMHAKALIVDGRWMYLGSANLTGAGLGAKSPRRRNFETGIWTDELSLIDTIGDMLEDVWSGRCCSDCGRTDYCPVPLEEPAGLGSAGD